MQELYSLSMGPFTISLLGSLNVTMTLFTFLPNYILLQIESPPFLIMKFDLSEINLQKPVSTSRNLRLLQSVQRNVCVSTAICV